MLADLKSVSDCASVAPNTWPLSLAAGTADANADRQEVADLESVLEDMYEKVEELQQVLKEHLSTKNALKVCAFVLMQCCLCSCSTEGICHTAQLPPPPPPPPSLAQHAFMVWFIILGFPLQNLVQGVIWSCVNSTLQSYSL